jgi:hypothetical protein
MYAAAGGHRTAASWREDAFLQDLVIEEALHHSYRHCWKLVVPTGRLMTAQAANLIALACWPRVVPSAMRPARVQQGRHDRRTAPLAPSGNRRAG